MLRDQYPNIHYRPGVQGERITWARLGWNHTASMRKAYIRAMRLPELMPGWRAWLAKERARIASMRPLMHPELLP